MIKTGNNSKMNEATEVRNMDLKEASKAKEDATYAVGQISSLLSYLEHYASTYPDFGKDIKNYIDQSRKAVQICTVHGTRANERILQIKRDSK